MDVLKGIRTYGRGVVACHRWRYACGRAAVATGAAVVGMVLMGVSAVASADAAGEVSRADGMLTTEYLEWVVTRPALAVAVDDFINALPSRGLLDRNDGGGGAGGDGNHNGSSDDRGVRLQFAMSHAASSNVPPVTAGGIGDLNDDGTGDRLWGDGARNVLEVGYTPTDQSAGVVYTTPVDTSPLPLSPGDSFGSALAGLPGPFAFVGAPKAGGGDGAMYLLSLERVPSGSSSAPAAYPTWTIAEQGILRPGEGEWGALLPAGTGFAASLSVMEDAVVGDSGAELDVLVGDMEGNVFGVAVGRGMTVARVVRIRKAPSSSSPEASPSRTAPSAASPSAAPETAAPAPTTTASSPPATASATPEPSAAPAASPRPTASPMASALPTMSATATASPSSAPSPTRDPTPSPMPPMAPSEAPEQRERTPSATPTARPSCLYTPTLCDCAPVSALLDAHRRGLSRRVRPASLPPPPVYGRVDVLLPKQQRLT
ncbi:hypothetical protein MMPV_000703 [Pyropia vietnamensis]